MAHIERFIDTLEAVILTGMRRVGKTTILKYFYDKIDDKSKVFIDCENIVNRRYFEDENYEGIKKSLEFLGIDFSKRSFIFIDEIQFVKNLPSIVKYFIDHYSVKFFLTGSASFYLKNLFTESLAGRKVVFEVFPLNFQEFLHFKGIDLAIPQGVSSISKAIYDTISPLYDEYILFGGFPQVVLKSDVGAKKSALEDIFNSYFQLEVIQLGDFRKNETIRDLMFLLMQSVGSKIDIQRISRDIGVSRQTVYDYLAFLEGTYFISTIKPFSQGKSTEIKKAPKVYVCDSGLINHFARLDEGHVLENNVFQNLRAKGQINYYQRKSGVEIDFILDKEIAFEVKMTADKHNVTRLKVMTDELRLKKCYVVTKRYCSLNENVIYGFMI